MVLKTNNDIIRSEDNKHLFTEISKRDYNKLNNLIESGIFISSSDFIHEAIKEKLNQYEVINLRDISKKEAEEEILQYCNKKDIFDVGEIADDLELDVFMVNDIVSELISRGIITEDI